MKLIISKLPRPEHCGDWHDKPLRWQVAGPDRELQKFSTKKDAMLYRRIRKHARDFNEASTAFVMA